eukprot:9742764-Alexandrium_andersonii.AAC.1
MTPLASSVTTPPRKSPLARRPQSWARTRGPSPQPDRRGTGVRPGAPRHSGGTGPGPGRG